MGHFMLCSCSVHVLCDIVLDCRGSVVRRAITGSYHTPCGIRLDQSEVSLSTFTTTAPSMAKLIAANVLQSDSLNKLLVPMTLDDEHLSFMQHEKTEMKKLHRLQPSVPSFADMEIHGVA